MRERTWAMRRLGPGDYICWSNDRSQLWRFHAYVDGAGQGLDVDYQERTFWRAVWMPADAVWLHADANAGELPGPWSDAWIESDWCLPTRRAAVDRMLHHPLTAGSTRGG